MTTISDVLAFFGFAAILIVCIGAVVAVIEHIERLKRVERVVDRIEARLMDDVEGDDADAE